MSFTQMPPEGPVDACSDEDRALLIRLTWGLQFKGDDKDKPEVLEWWTTSWQKSTVENNT